MPKKNDPIQQAMSEALQSVERIEQERVSQEQPQDSCNGGTVHVEVENGENDEGVAVDLDGQDPEPIGDGEVVEIAEEGDEAADDAAALKDQLLRLAADFENFRKRAQRQHDEARRYGSENLLLDLLPVLDNLERALAHSGEHEDPVLQGVRMVLRQFLGVLEKHGAGGFESLGEAFDPHRHEAVGQAPAGDDEAGSILEELQRGYMLHDRLLRPAKVIVALAPPEPASEPNGDEVAQSDTAADENDSNKP